MKHLGSLLTITIGVGMLVGAVSSGCGGDTAQITSGGNGASGGNGSGGEGNASSSSGGGGGAGECSTGADCSDGFSCTIDTCNAGTCEHTVGPNSGSTSCPSGQICNLDFGCVDLIICADDATCIDKLGMDPCKANVHCDQAMSICSYTILDKDNDGQAPLVCNGKDCDDSKSDTYTGAPEKCDGRDNDCDGATDEMVTCPGMGVCQAGACVCPPENACGTDCVDLTTSNTHCGTCNNACAGAASCINGQCVCPANSTNCGTTCVDTTTDPLNCGGCDKICAAGYSCFNSLCTCLKTPCGTQCIDTMNDPLNCGGCNMACPFLSQCQNGTCTCPAGETYCGGQCLDTKTNPMHCGGCNKPCNGICQNGACTMCTAASLYLFADASGSMSGTKFDSMRTAIGTFMSDPLSTNLGVGLGYHPVTTATTGNVCLSTGLPCATTAECAMGDLCLPAGGTTASCVQTDYQTPTVAIGLLPGNQTPINNSLAAKSPTGSSTPPPGLRGALQYAKNYATANPTQKVGLVYFIDNMPNTCASTNDVPTDLIPIAQQYANGTPRVVTYVIGIGPNVTTAELNQIAAAGGTSTGFLTTTSAEMNSALNAIRTQFRTCQ